MNQGVPASTDAPETGRFVRLMLIFFGTVLGLLVLSFVFGSSSASADDGDGLGTELGGLVATVTTPVEQTVAAVTSAPAAPAAAPVAAITTPVAATVDSTLTTLVGSSALADVLGTTPVTSVLEPVVALVDTTLTDVGSAFGPIAGTLDLAGVLGRDLAVSAVPASTAIATAATLISGAAAANIDQGLSPVGDGPIGALSSAAAPGGLLATTLGAGLFALLLLRRERFSHGEMPGSPVYATDTSPD